MINKKVLHIINGEYYAGAEKVQDILAIFLPDYGWDVEFFLIKKGVFRNHMISKSVVYTGFMRSRFDFSILLNIFRVIKKNQLNIVHSHTIRSLIFGAAARFFCGVELVHHCHSSEVISSKEGVIDFLNKKIDFFLLRNFPDKIIAVSEGAKKYLLNIGVQEKKIYLVYNGVKDKEIKIHVAKPDRDFEFICVALFRQRKGVEVLLKAFAKFAERNSGEFRLALVGDFETIEYKNEIEQLIMALDIGEQVELEGFCSDVTGRMCAASCLIFPSVRPEGLPMVLLEAMSVGLPIISSSVDGATEVIEHGVNGILVEPDNVGKLADAMSEMTSEYFSGRIQEISERAQKFQRDNFSGRSMAEKIAAIYDGSV